MVAVDTVQPDTTPRDRRVLQRTAIAANAGVLAVGVAAGSTSGDLLQLYAAHALGLSPARIGAAMSLLSLGLLAQLGGVHLARRIGKKRLMRLGYAATAVALVPFLFLPSVFALHRGAGYAVFVVIIVAVECCQAASWGTSWMAWVREFAPPGERARFLSRMRVVTNLCLVTLVAVFTAAVGERVSAREYDVLVLVLIGYLVGSVALMGRLPDAEADSGPAAHRSARRAAYRVSYRAAHRAVHPAVHPAGGGAARAAVRDVLAELRAGVGDGPTRRLLTIVALSCLTTMPLFVLYAQGPLGLSVRTTGLIVAGRTALFVAGMLWWGRVTDRIGFAPILRRAGLALVPASLAWLLVPPADGRAGLLTLVVVTALVTAVAVCNSAISIGWLTGLHEVVRTSTAVAVFTVADIAGTLVARAAFWVAGVLIDHVPATRITVAGVAHLDGYRALLVAAAGAGVLIAMLTPRPADGAP